MVSTSAALRRSRGLLDLAHKLFELPQRKSLRARIWQPRNLQLLSRADLQQQAHSPLEHSTTSSMTLSLLQSHVYSQQAAARIDVLQQAASAHHCGSLLDRQLPDLKLRSRQHHCNTLAAC